MGPLDGHSAEEAIAAGYAARRARQLDVALDDYRRAEALLRQGGDPLRLAHTVRHVGDILGELGRFDEAVLCFEEALRIYNVHADASRLDVANAHSGFARTLGAHGDQARAREHWAQALQLYRELEIDAGVNEAEKHLSV